MPGTDGATASQSRTTVVCTLLFVRRKRLLHKLSTD